MRSLFAKILLWFLATVMVAFVGFSIIAVVSYNDPMRMPPMARAFQFQAREASEAYEAGGEATTAKSVGRNDFRNVNSALTVAQHVFARRATTSMSRVPSQIDP